MTDVLERTADTGARAPRRTRRVIWASAIAVAVSVAAVVLVWFQPQRLLINERVDDVIPASRAPGDASSTPEASAPVERARGEFISRDHSTSGTARVLVLEGGQSIVRFEALDTDNGPDLYVYLTTTPADGDEGAFDDDFVNLGRLKGNQGQQNYDLPAGTDLARYATVVIWCDRFNSAFGAAALRLA